MQTELRLEKKRDLRHKIMLTEAQLHRLPNLDNMRRERWDAQRRIDSLTYRFGPDIKAWPAQKRADYHGAKQTVDRVMAAVRAADEKEKQIRTQLEDLHQQLAGLDQQIATEELLQLHATFKELSERVEHLQRLIEEGQGGIAGDEQDNNHTLARLTKEREDLLAALACGESTDNERLAALSLEIEKEEGLHDVHVDAMITASQTIAGLSRKIDQAKKELAVARQDYLDGLSIFLGQELEQAGGDYVKAAGRLAASYSRVIALSTILEQCGTPKEVFGTYTRQFQIPSFLLDACMARETSVKPGVLYQYDGGGILEMVANETERLKTLGIELLT